MNLLTNEIVFPNVEAADTDGLLAVGGDLSLERLMLAYQSGIFPWYEASQPILWWSPDPRMVLYINDFKVSKSLQKTIKNKVFTVTFNQAFETVINHCATIKRAGQRGTWITKEMKQAYQHLHASGHALSFEVWQEDRLVGGGYGVHLPDQKMFCGESMFSLVSNASKVGFVALVNQCIKKGYKLIDCQVYTTHLERFGAKEIPRTTFVKYLKR